MASPSVDTGVQHACIEDAPGGVDPLTDVALEQLEAVYEERTCEPAVVQACRVQGAGDVLVQLTGATRTQEAWTAWVYDRDTRAHLAGHRGPGDEACPDGWWHGDEAWRPCLADAWRARRRLPEACDGRPLEEARRGTCGRGACVSIDTTWTELSDGRP